MKVSMPKDRTKGPGFWRRFLLPLINFPRETERQRRWRLMRESLKRDGA